jgi:hypothetical protein
MTADPSTEGITWGSGSDSMPIIIDSIVASDSGASQILTFLSSQYGYHYNGTTVDYSGFIKWATTDTLQGGTAGSAWSVPPADKLTFGCEFAIPCRFDSELSITQPNDNTLQTSSLKIIELVNI